MRPGLLVVVLAAGATLGGAIGSAAAPGPDLPLFTRACHPDAWSTCARPARHCRPRPRHGCPAKRKRPPRPRPTTTTTSTTTTTTATLPSRLEVDENDQGPVAQPYSLLPSHNPVAAGTVQLNVYNFGQDAHTFAIVDPSGHQLTLVDLPPGQPQTAVTVSAKLAPGRYTLECTLSGHVALGMVATLTVR